jgi:hypothetical protein
MRGSRYPLAAVLVACLLSAFAACELETPDRYVRPPIIKGFSPRSASFAAAVGDSLRFSIAAIDLDNQSLHYSFVLGDSVAGRDAKWTYVVDDTGKVDVHARVSNGLSESAIRWHLTRVLPVNLPPEIVSVDPPEPNITVILGGSIAFAISATDPEGKPLGYVYTIGDSIVSVSRRYTYESTSVGTFDVRAVVSDGESFVSHTWTVRVAAEPDANPPAKIVVVSLGPGVESGEVDIEWTAVGDDGMTGLPSYYILRTSPMPITDEHAWNLSSERFGEPAPVLAGEIMHMIVRDLPPAQTVFVAVRAVDDFGNISPISELASTRSRGMKVFGTVRDAVTASPIQGVRVRLSSAGDTTGTDGSFVLSDLPAGTSLIAAEDETSPAEFGDYFNVLRPYTIRDEDVLDIWMLPNISLDTGEYSSFLDFYNQMTALEGVTRNLLGRWDIPCRVYVPPLVANNIDYRQTVVDILREWESEIGIAVFEFVESIPDTGFYVDFNAGVDRESYLVTQHDKDGLQIQGRIAIRTVYTEAELPILQVIIRHEVGHALGMRHSTDVNHLMIEGRFPAVTHPSRDEVALVKAMYRIPRGTPPEWFRYD